MQYFGQALEAELRDTIFGAFRNDFQRMCRCAMPDPFSSASTAQDHLRIYLNSNSFSLGLGDMVKLLRTVASRDSALMEGFHEFLTAFAPELFSKVHSLPFDRILQLRNAASHPDGKDWGRDDALEMSARCRSVLSLIVLSGRPDWTG